MVEAYTVEAYTVEAYTEAGCTGMVVVGVMMLVAQEVVVELVVDLATTQQGSFRMSVQVATTSKKPPTNMLVRERGISKWYQCQSTQETTYKYVGQGA